MTTREAESERAARLIDKALNGLPDRERREVVRYLIRSCLAGGSPLMPTSGTWESAVVGPPSFGLEPLPRSQFPVMASGAEHQTLPVRLPEEQHAALKAWCNEHGFSMATVVRGLVENFLRTQTPPGGAS
jgi:hypothetical protein